MIDETQHLAEADRHIAAAEHLLTEQELRLQELKAAGRITTEAERLLANMRATLKEMYIHRQLIVNEIIRQQNLPHS
jgi:hypothetical protein